MEHAKGLASHELDLCCDGCCCLKYSVADMMGVANMEYCDDLQQL